MESAEERLVEVKCGETSAVSTADNKRTFDKATKRGTYRKGFESKGVTGGQLLLDVRQAGEMLSIPEKTLYDWSAQRKIPSVKIGGSLRFERSELLKLIAKSRRPALKDRPVDESAQIEISGGEPE